MKKRLKCSFNIYRYRYRYGHWQKNGSVVTFAKRYMQRDNIFLNVKIFYKLILKYKEQARSMKRQASNKERSVKLRTKHSILLRIAQRHNVL